MSIYQEKCLEAMLCMTRQCWEQGIVAQTLMEIGEEDKLDLVVYDMVLRQSEDGRLCNVENTPAITDSSFCIPATYYVGMKENNLDYIEAVKKNVEFLLKSENRAKDGTLYHMINFTDIWADSAAFLPYSLALTGHPKEAIVQLNGICKRLYHQESGLYYHMWNEEKQNFTRPIPWGVGNGWILTGILRLYMVLTDKFMDEKKKLIKEFKNLLNTILKYQTKNHLFHDIINDPNSFEESESSAMIAYAIYKAVKVGLIDDTYLKEADLIRKSLYKKVSKDGLVMDSVSSPDFVKAGTAVECQAHFLMMEAAYNQ